MNKNIYEGIKLIRQPKQLAAENDRYIRSVFAVESGAADSGSFYSPYSKEEYLEEDYDA